MSKKSGRHGYAYKRFEYFAVIVLKEDNLRVRAEERRRQDGVKRGDFAFVWCGRFVMTHYSFSSGTHGQVFTKPSAKIAQLN